MTTRGRMADWLVDARRLRRLVPDFVKRWARRSPLYRDYVERAFDRRSAAAIGESPSGRPRLGVVMEFSGGHGEWVDACRSLGVPYELVDLSGPDWIEVAERSTCDVFLVRPAGYLSVWKRMYDERLKVLVEELGRTIYPAYHEIWLYESKRRMHYWLAAQHLPHPRTWIYYRRAAALEFAAQAALPIVAKTDFGSGSSGVRILRDRRSLERWIRQAFGRGVDRGAGDARDREWGSVVLQEYLPDVREWRMVRVGEAYFGHLKQQRGDFHSGSGLAGWEDPPRELLDLARLVTERGRFTNMALDIFETPDRRCLVNELQTVFGYAASRASQMIVDGQSGRYLYDAAANTWRFEAGDFSGGGCYRLRVETVLKMLETREKPPAVSPENRRG